MWPVTARVPPSGYEAMVSATPLRIPSASADRSAESDSKDTSLDTVTFTESSVVSSLVDRSTASM